MSLSPLDLVALFRCLAFGPFGLLDFWLRIFSTQQSHSCGFDKTFDNIKVCLCIFLICCRYSFVGFAFWCFGQTNYLSYKQKCISLAFEAIASSSGGIQTNLLLALIINHKLPQLLLLIAIILPGLDCIRCFLLWSLSD